MNKKILLFLAVLLVQFKYIFALTLNYNLSSIIPNIPEPNSNASVTLCLINELYPTELYSVYIDLNTSDSCIQLNENEVYFDSIDKGVCFPVDLSIGNCSDGEYWISLNERYFVNGNIQTGSDYFLFTVYQRPEIIVTYNVSNNYIGKEANLNLYITNFGGMVRDLAIYTNYSLCEISPQELYIGDLNNEVSINFNVTIPTYVSGSCNIPIIISYMDSLGNSYTLPELISFPVYALGGSLILSFGNTTLKPGEYGNITVYVENEGNMTFYNVLVLFNSIQGLSFDKQEVYIDKMLPGEKKVLVIQVYPDIDLAGGLYDIPVDLSYTDEYGNKYSSVFSLPLTINEEPNLSVSAWVSGNILYVMVFNFGNVNATAVYLKLSCERCVLDREDSFLGEIDTGESLTDSFRILAANANPSVTIDVLYKDPLGNVYTESFTKSINLFGMNFQHRRASSGYEEIEILAILILIAAIIFIVVYRRRARK